MDSGPTELISDDGGFKENELINSVKFHECGVSYAVVAIMGAQDTGKSTLLNHVFHTNFTERNIASSIRGKATTKGVWISKSQKEPPFTLNDTTFEKQSSVFAFVFADILLINMWSRDFGRDHGANRPLLRTIFEVVITMSSFTPRKTTLFFVMRDTVMVATVRCQQIAQEKLSLFASNQDWLDVGNAAENGIVTGFSATIRSILGTYLSQYDLESKYFEQGVRDEKRRYLESEALKTQLQNLVSSEQGEFVQSVLNCKDSCMLQFDRQCSDFAIEQARWDASTVRSELLRNIEYYVADHCQKRLFVKLESELSRLFSELNEHLTWSTVRRLLRRESDVAASDLSCTATHLLERDIMLNEMKQYARQIVERKFKDQNNDVLGLLKKRYHAVLGSEYVQRSDPSDDEAEKAFSTAINEAYRQCLKLLSTMAVLRLDERDNDDDVVERMLSSELMVDRVSDEDPLASSTWEEIPAEVTLITPSQCRDILEKFKREMERNLSDANHVENLSRKDNRWSPPRWVIVALAALGIVGLIALLRATNMDLALLASYSARGIKIAGVGIAIGVEGMDLYRSIQELLQQGNNNINAINEFRTRHDKIIKSLERALREFSEYMTTSIARKSPVETTASI
ncbi:hypothetical protein C2S51_016095 [Perilla frutescens var. frutescens]|nr:hypothetical protein C2S51_016095 [Perilla frutescens var. frutescens]